MTRVSLSNETDARRSECRSVIACRWLEHGYVYVLRTTSACSATDQRRPPVRVASRARQARIRCCLYTSVADPRSCVGRNVFHSQFIRRDGVVVVPGVCAAWSTVSSVTQKSTSVSAWGRRRRITAPRGAARNTRTRGICTSCHSTYTAHSTSGWLEPDWWHSWKNCPGEASGRKTEDINTKNWMGVQYSQYLPLLLIAVCWSVVKQKLISVIRLRKLLAAFQLGLDRTNSGIQLYTYTSPQHSRIVAIW